MQIKVTSLSYIQVYVVKPQNHTNFSYFPSFGKTKRGSRENLVGRGFIEWITVSWNSFIIYVLVFVWRNRRGGFCQNRRVQGLEVKIDGATRSPWSDRQLASMDTFCFVPSFVFVSQQRYVFSRAFGEVCRSKARYFVALQFPFQFSSKQHGRLNRSN